MRRLGHGWCFAALFWLAGCDGGGGLRIVQGDAGADGSPGVPVDLAVGADAGSDAGSDMGSPFDMAAPLDVAFPPDMAAPLDMAAPPAPDAGPPPLQPDPAVFDPTRLVEVDVQMDPADWDALRVQNRGELDLARPDCLDEPFPSPYDWFPARVTVDGEVYAQVGIRKKGFYGSVSSSRPSVRIAFDEYVDGQTHRGLTRMALNNGRQDQSRLRTCLAYGVFAAHGVPAPRCNFARLTVNGQPMGVYAHVESIRRPFLAAHFGDPDGWLYEGTLSDFRPEWKGTIEQKTREDAPHTGGIDGVIAALAAPDEGLIAALEQVVDLDAFMTFWATESLTAHWDGYAGNTNNFWFYEHPRDGLIRFIPWGPDATFQAPRLFFEGRLAPHSVFAVGAITRRLYLHPEGRARYVARLGELLDRWDAAALDAEIDRMQALIAPALLPGERQRQGAAVAELRRFVAAKADAVRAELAAGGAAWNLPLRDVPCTEPVGILRGAFETTWGAWPTDNAFEAGGGMFEGVYLDTESVAVAAGAAAGFGEQGEAVLVLSQLFGDGTITFVYLASDPARFTPGAFLLDEQVYCAFSVLDRQSGQVFELGRCRTGQVVFDAAEVADGAPVRGTFRLGIWGRVPPTP